jgi:FkbM family methyltransferase
MVFNQFDAYVGRSLLIYGEWSGLEVDQIYKQLIHSGNTVLDIGANVGAFTLPFSNLVGLLGTVHAFEAQRVPAQMIAANLALNGKVNGFVYQKAVGAQRGKTEMADFLHPGVLRGKFNYAGLGIGAEVPLDHPYIKSRSVEIISIDSLKLEACHFMKIDIEGAELEALKGAAKTISTFKPAIYIEIDRMEKVPAVLEWLDQAEYKCFHHNPPLYNPNNFLKNSENVFQGIVSKNALCVHPSQTAHMEVAQGLALQPTTLTRSRPDL